jgi:hypothetical protein
MLTRLSVLITLGAVTSSCGPEENANFTYAKDCFNGCDRSYQSHVRDFKGDDGADSVSTNTTVTSTIVRETAIPGPQGPAGAGGADGSSCSVNQLDNGAVILCEDGSSSYILNGQDGEDGASSLVEIIDPCGTETTFDEVLLVYEIDGSPVFIAYFENGSKRYLTTLDEGINYRTTDGTKCDFTIQNGELIEL